MREATSVNKGWVAVGLVLLVSGLAGFQVINSPAYAQTTENDTLDTSSLTDLPSNLIQSQLEPDKDSLIATPGLSADDLNPQSQQDPSTIRQSPTPNTDESSENVAGEQSLDTGETIDNSIVQTPGPRSDRPDAGEQINQPSTDDNDNSVREDQRGNQEADEADDDSGDEDEEDVEDVEDEGEDVEGDNNAEIPSSLRNWLPFP